MELPRTLSALHQDLEQKFTNIGSTTADKDARLIIHAHTGFEWADLIARPNQDIAQDALDKISADTQRRLGGEPVSRIYAEREFWGLNFKISPDTLDPRPDTETIIDIALTLYANEPPQSILDLGTGSGCILTALLSEFKDAHGIGTDMSYDALKTAKHNAEHNGVGDRASFFCGSWGAALGKRFDLIVSNPPYISNQIIPTLSKEVQNHDPILALDGGNDGLDAYRNIFNELNLYLNPEKTALFEIGYDQQDDVVRLAEESRLLVRGVHHDLAGQPRVVEISSGDK